MDKYVVVRTNIRDAQMLYLPPDVDTQEEYERCVELANDEDPALLDNGFGWGDADNVEHFLCVIEANTKTEAINQYATNSGVSPMVLDAYKI